MERFSAAIYGGAMANLGMLGSSVMAYRTGDIPFDSEARQQMHDQFHQEVIEAVRELPLTRSTRNMLDRFVGRVLDEGYSPEAIEAILPEFVQVIGVDMTTHLFLIIPAERRDLYQQDHPPFGDEVDGVFPLAKRDISAAARCVALEEWTSCVFHLMRVLEIGLHDLAERVGLLSKDHELQNWKNIIDRIEKSVRKLEQLPRNPEKVEKVRFYAEAVNGFRLFKDAWRNHVSHSSVFYEERETLGIYNSTQTFMQVLARGPREVDA